MIIKTLIKSKDLREEFVLDFIDNGRCDTGESGKNEPFLLKYCKQAGILPRASTLRSQYDPRAYYQAVKSLRSSATSLFES